MEKQEFIRKQLELSQRIIQQNYPLPPNKIQQKNKHEIVTPIDNRIEKDIKQSIEHTYPEHNIVGEETGQTKNNSNYTWILDPIDGTTNYAHNIPFFCTAITLLYKQKPLHAGIIQHITNDIWLATKNQGATKNNNSITTSQKPMKKSLFGYCHKNTNITKTLNIVKYLKENVYDARRLGSANLELALVADGSLQGFVGHNLPPWDFKPGCLILQEAKGYIQGWKGSDWTNTNTKNILATTQKPSKKLLDTLKKNV